MLPVPSNGTISYDADTNTATYRCNRGFGIAPNSGNVQRTCQSNNQWSGSPPTCVGRQSLYIVITFVPSHSTFGSDLPVYQTISLLCTVYCPVLPTLANGQITYSSGSSTVRPIDTVATYSCNPGFALNSGNVQRTCQSNNQWSGSPPTCVGRQSLYIVITFVPSHSTFGSDLPVYQTISLLCTVYCPVLPTLANGRITYSSGSSDVRPVGTVATHRCNPGFALNSGNEQRTCQSNSSWNGSQPTCVGNPIHSYGGSIICSLTQYLAQTSLHQPMEVS